MAELRQATQPRASDPVGLPLAPRLGTALAAMLLIAAASFLAAELIWLGIVAGSAALLALERRGQRWAPNIWLATLVLAVGGLGDPAPLLLVALLCALAYWDLTAFDRRLRQAAYLFDRQILLRRHLVYLATALAVGGGLGALALSGDLELSFVAAAALVAGLLVGLRQLTGRS